MSEPEMEDTKNKGEHSRDLKGQISHRDICAGVAGMEAPKLRPCH